LRVPPRCPGKSSLGNRAFLESYGKLEAGISVIVRLIVHRDSNRGLKRGEVDGAIIG
jgi:hypothetical protein